MTVQVNDRRKEYIGNGVAVTFNGPRAFLKAQIQVYKGTDDVLAPVPASAFEVTGLGTAQTRVVFDVAPALNDDILILRTVLFDQPTDVTNLGQFLPEIHENAFDYRCFQIQQLVDGTMQLEFDPETGAFVWNAKQHRIINVGDPLGLQDAVNLRTLNTAVEEGGGGPGSGVLPKLYQFEGDGEQVEWPMPLADVDDPLFYDTALEIGADSGDFACQRPGVDFFIFPGDDSTSRVIRFNTIPPAGCRGFVVLRGYARGSATEYVTTLAIPTFTESTTAAEVTSAKEYGLIETTNNSAVALTIRANTGSVLDWLTGQYFSVTQVGAGQVTIGATGITIVVPAGFQAKTRGVGATITARCSFADANLWYLSGDLLAVAATPEYIVIQLHDRAALSGSNIAAGVLRGQFTMPFGMVLRPIANGGVYADLMVAQAAGSALTVDVNRNGTSIFATRLTFDNTEKTTTTAAAAAVYAALGDVLNAGDVITFDVDTIGTALAKGLAIYLVGQRAS